MMMMIDDDKLGLLGRMRRNAQANKILIICNMSTQMTMG